MDVDTIRKLAACDAGVALLADMLAVPGLVTCRLEETDGVLEETYDDGSRITWSSGCVRDVFSPSGEPLLPCSAVAR